MPNHTISSTFKDDAGSVPIGGTTYVVNAELNESLKVPAGSVNLEFDFTFLHTKVNDYCLSLATQTAAQAAANPQGYTEAASGALVVNVNSITTPAPVLTVNAKQPHVLAACLPGTTNEFSADVTKFFISNSGSTDLVLLVKVGLNT